MKQIQVTDETYERLAFAAKVFGVSLAEVVDRLMSLDDQRPTPQHQPIQQPATTTHQAPAQPQATTTHQAPAQPQATTTHQIPTQQPEPATATEQFPVHVIYQGSRVNGVFDRLTNQLRITNGSLAGRTYPSPSAAAIAVVESLNPGRQFPQTNGRTFWIVTSTGRTLRSIIGRR